MHPHNTTQEIPYGYCYCGCGQLTPLSKKTSTRDGTVKGHPVRFIAGHAGIRPLEERFWEKVNKRGPDDCWLWDKPDKQTGYGRIYVAGSIVGTHRASWELHNGPIPYGLQVLHKCDVRNCVNPAHLFLGTQADNAHDCLSKGRNTVPREKRALGERSGKTTLTNSQVLDIRRRAEQGERHSSIARIYGVVHSTISDIVKRLTWSHI